MKSLVLELGKILDVSPSKQFKIVLSKLQHWLRQIVVVYLFPERNRKCTDLGLYLLLHFWKVLRDLFVKPWDNTITIPDLQAKWPGRRKNERQTHWLYVWLHMWMWVTPDTLIRKKASAKPSGRHETETSGKYYTGINLKDVQRIWTRVEADMKAKAERPRESKQTFAHQPLFIVLNDNK